jgi:hypothetical protein
MFHSRRLVGIVVALLGLALIASSFVVTSAQDKAGFTPTYRSWTRLKVSHISDGKPFASLNPLNADLVGFLTTYANDKALGWYIGGKKGPAPEGAVAVVELSKFDKLAGGVVLSEKAGPNPTVWMIKDSAAPKETGGWRWELWTISKDGKDTQVPLDVKQQVAGCVTCHQQFSGGVAAKTDLTFTVFTDTGHVKNYADKLGMAMSGDISSTMAATMAATKAK